MLEVVDILIPRLGSDWIPLKLPPYLDMTCFEDDAVAVAGLGHFLVRPRVFVLRFDCRLLKLRSCGEDAFFFFSNMAMRLLSDLLPMLEVFDI